jgi:hypothetical protein
MTINSQTLSTLAELAMEARVPDCAARRVDIVPDYIAGHGRLKLFRSERVAELAAAVASRRAHTHAVNTAGPKGGAK